MPGDRAVACENAELPVCYLSGWQVQVPHDEFELRVLSAKYIPTRAGRHKRDGVQPVPGQLVLGCRQQLARRVRVRRGVQRRRRELFAGRVVGELGRGVHGRVCYDFKQESYVGGQRDRLECSHKLVV